MSAAMMPVALLAWKSLPRNSLRGFATVRLGRSLSIKDVAVHSSNGKKWASLPAKPIIDASGQAKKNDAGKMQYVPILEWEDRESANRFSDAVVAAVEAEHPGETDA